MILPLDTKEVTMRQDVPLLPKGLQICPTPLNCAAMRSLTTFFIALCLLFGSAFALSAQQPPPVPPAPKPTAMTPTGPPPPAAAPVTIQDVIKKMGFLAYPLI